MPTRRERGTGRGPRIVPWVSRTGGPGSLRSGDSSPRRRSGVGRGDGPVPTRGLPVVVGLPVLSFVLGRAFGQEGHRVECPVAPERTFDDRLGAIYEGTRDFLPVHNREALDAVRQDEPRARSTLRSLDRSRLHDAVDAEVVAEVGVAGRIHELGDREVVD